MRIRILWEWRGVRSRFLSKSDERTLRLANITRKYVDKIFFFFGDIYISEHFGNNNFFNEPFAMGMKGKMFPKLLGGGITS